MYNGFALSGKIVKKRVQTYIYPKLIYINMVILDYDADINYLYRP